MADLKISALPASTTPLAGTEVVPLVQSGTTKKVAVSDLTAGRSVATGQLTATSTTDSGAVVRGWSPNGGANNSNGSIQIGGVAAYAGRISSDATGGTIGMVYIDSTYNDSSSRIRARLRTDGTPIVGWTLVPNAATADLQINTGNIILSTAAKGVNFTANTPAAGMTSQLLNWYERGTFTPTQGAGLTVVGAFSSSGYYTRIGNQVTVTASVSGTTSVAVTAAGVISGGLPFSAAMTAIGSATNASANVSVSTYISGTNMLSCSAITATTSIFFTATYFV